MHRTREPAPPHANANGAAAAAPPPAPAPPPAVPEFRPGQVYTIAALTEALQLRKGTLPRELRLGRLRYAKRAGKVLILGEWVLEWLAAGELTRQPDQAEAD